MLPLKGTFGDRDITAKKIPRNPRYQGIGPVVDTGHSLSKHLASLRDKFSKYKYRQNELFKRMRHGTLGRLLLETAQEFDLNTFEKNLLTSNPILHQQEKQQSHLTNFGESHVIQSDVDMLQRQEDEARLKSQVPDKDLPFLLLDVRDEESYERGHIVTAKHFLKANGSNSCQKDIVRYRNQPDKLIIVYDFDEEMAAIVAQQFAERGVENIWILSGGLKVLLEEIDGIFIGSVSLPQEGGRVSASLATFSVNAMGSRTASRIQKQRSEFRKPPAFFKESMDEEVESAVIPNSQPNGFDLRALSMSLYHSSAESSAYDRKSVRSVSSYSRQSVMSRRT